MDPRHLPVFFKVSLLSPFIFFKNFDCHVEFIHVGKSGRHKILLYSFTELSHRISLLHIFPITSSLRCPVSLIGYNVILLDIVHDYLNTVRYRQPVSTQMNFRIFRLFIRSAYPGELSNDAFPCLPI